jgi:hypothetical protein
MQQAKETCVIPRVIGAALIGAGVVLAVLGLRADSSTASYFTRLVSGSPTKPTVLLLAGAGAAVLVGMTLFVSPGVRRTSRAR